MPYPTEENRDENQGVGRLLRALNADHTIRLIASDTTAVVEGLRVAHDAGPIGTLALSRTATAVALMSATLKERQQVGIQVNGNGPVGEAYAIADSKGHIRSTVMHPKAELDDGAIDLPKGFGLGRLTITRQLDDGSPYRGVVPLVHGGLAEDLAHYYLSSEQINSAVSLGETLVSTGVEVAGGFLVQAMPGADDADVGRLIHRIESLPSISDLLSTCPDLETVVQTVMPDAEIVAEQSVELRCNCSRENFARRICTLGADELERLTEELEIVDVQCHFCRIQYAFDREQVNALLYGARMYDEAD